MPDEPPPFHPTFPVVLSAESTTEIAIVSVAQPLTPQEIERMCKAFIRLITAKEIESYAKPTSTTNRKSRHLHQSRIADETDAKSSKE